MTPYYDRAGITIYCGDCLEVMPQLDMVFDAIICDLPYGTTACAWDTIIPFEPLWENYKRLVKANGAVVLFGSSPFNYHLFNSNPDWFRYEWIWNKKKGGNYIRAKFVPIRVHEFVMIFYKQTGCYNPVMTKANPDNIRPPSISKVSSTFFRPPTTGVFKNSENYNSEERYPLSLLEYDINKNECNSTNRLHPTQKPVALLAYLIRTYTNPGEIILDNCIGSGTTLLAAQNEGRRAIGIEISEEYCKIAVDRLRQPSFFSIPDKPKTDQPKQKALL